ncbi:prolactin receptor a [Scleropages formosus]|uniref:Prolactin receptor n=1 Tax=Scleropages formosus TaxID=113540 RepID=A0A8C9V8B9_SCLFO|nr:prolactin receptor [Scleropages formosus]
MMSRDSGASLILSLLISAVLDSDGLSPPGKPRLTSCRSPEKETFTCWWEPGSDGGLPTNYSLFYRKENSDTVYECPDYHTAGRNSCFFSKNDTSIWVNYNITVVATNALGSNFSDPVDVDVVYIVQPHTPENLTVVLEDEDNPFLVVRWEPPRMADTRSGWITLIYQLRVKLEKEEEWEEHFAGQQKQFNIFSLHSGEVYMVQVRCKPDHGFWSEWSATTYVKVPDYISRERSIWILIAVFSTFIFFVFIWTMHINRNSVKHFLLPPVPGPKIKGFDTQLLKSGKSEAVFSALVIQGYPPTSYYDDLLVEYLEVYDNKEQVLMLDRKDLQESLFKSKSSSDTDSGRGSCDSHTLLMEKCVEPKEDQTMMPQVKDSEASRDLVMKNDSNTPESTNVKTKTWPTICSSYHYDQNPCYHSIPEMPRQCHISSNHFASTHQQDYWESPADIYHKKPPSGYRYAQAYSEFNIKGIALKEATFPASKSLEYVEVQHVNQENTLILKPIGQEGPDLFHAACTGHDYSRVNRVVSDNVFLLQRDTSGQCHSDCQEREAPVRSCTQQQPGKPADHLQVPRVQETHLAPNGYVDTATMLSY